MAFLGKYMQKYVFSGENTRKALLLVNQWNKKRKRNFGSGWSLPWLSSSPEFYRRITDNFKRALEHQGFSNFVIFSLLW